MLTAICLVAFTSLTTGEPVVVNATTVAYLEGFETNGKQATSLVYSYRTAIAVSETAQEIQDKIVAQCNHGQPAN